MDSELIADRIEYMRQFMLQERYDILQRVLSNRTKYMTVCLEDVFHSQNASAVIRSCEALGLQDIHVIEDKVHFKANADIVRGADKWVDIRRYRAPEHGTEYLIKKLRKKGYRIVATSPHSGDTTPQTFDVSKGPFALFFGTEKQGISQTVVEHADDFIKIPMYGFVESLNLSVCAATITHSLIERIRADKDIKWQLTDRERTLLLYKWMQYSLKDAEHILERYETRLEIV